MHERSFIINPYTDPEVWATVSQQMRPLLDWLTTNRLAVSLGVVSLIVLGVVSAGSSSADGEWVQVPNLGFLFAVTIGLLAFIGLILLIMGGADQKAERTSGEQRTVRSLLILVAIVAIGIIFFGPNEEAEEQPTVVEQTEPATESEGGEVAVNDPSNLTGTDLAAMILVGLILAIGLAHILRRSDGDPDPPQASDLRSKLAPAVKQAHRQLEDETDPRSGVLLAYASLERALTELDMPREATETPREHMARVLVDLSDLEAPAVRLGDLYQRARFSNADVSESERTEARDMLASAKSALPTPEADFA